MQPQVVEVMNNTSQVKEHDEEGFHFLEDEVLFYGWE